MKNSEPRGTCVSTVVIFSLIIIVLYAPTTHVVFAAQAQPGWQQEWEKILGAAKKEGQLTIYISGYEAVLPHFEREFPEIKVNAVTARGNQLGQRLLSERRGGENMADVVSSGAQPQFKNVF